MNCRRAERTTLGPMVARPEFVSLLQDELAALAHISTRRMFGKTGVFCEGVM